MHRPQSNNNNDNIIEVKNNILEEGIECFTHWLSAEEGNSEKNSYIQLTLKIFEKDNRIIIHDYFQNIDIEVKFDNGIPLCTLCNTSECAHVDLQFVRNKIFPPLIFIIAGSQEIEVLEGYNISINCYHNVLHYVAR